MFENYYFFLLFLLPVVLLFFTKRRYYLRHAYVNSLTQLRPKSKIKKLQGGCTVLGWIFLVLAAVNIFWGMTQMQRRQPVHKFVMINDGSGSMVDHLKSNGMGERLIPLHKGNEALLDMLDKRNDGSRDIVGAIVFSNDAFIVSYMVDDPKFVAKKLAMIDYRRSPLCSGTELAAALLAGIDMILSNEKEPDDDLTVLYNRMYSSGHNYKRDGMENTIKKYNAISKHSCIIIFTDGEFDMPAGGVRRMSIYKLLHLCKDLGIRVYVISVATVDNSVERYTRNTGGFSVIFHGFEESKFRKAYEDIVRNQTNDEIVVEQQIQKPLATILGAIALGFLGIGLLLRLTLDRNFTEV